MFKIGDKLTKENYTAGAIWGNKNNAEVKLIGGEYVLVAMPEPTEEELKQARINELQQYLSETDWYAIRESETGIDIPAEVKKARANARAEISSLRGDEEPLAEPEPVAEEPVVELSEASEDVVELYSMEI
jgi:hypothetical protein